MNKNTQQNYVAIHPGLVLKDELEELEITQSALAKHIGVLDKTINEICRCRRGINTQMAVKLSFALGGSPEFWLRLQNNWKLSQIDPSNFKKIKKIAA